jgi:methyl-accepting chemotaxis protein
MRSLKQKMLVLFGTLTLVILVGVMFASFYTASDQMEEMYLDQALNETLNASEIFLEDKFGGFETSQGELKGVMGQDNDAITSTLDLLSFQLDRVFTLFNYQNDTFTRQSTSITDEDGQRLTGTALNNDNIEAELLNKESYLGEDTIAGTAYYTAYRPVLNRDGEIIGALFTGAPKSEIDQLIGTYLNHMRPVFLTVGVIAIVVMLLVVFILSQSLVGPLTQLKTLATRIGEKDLTVEVPEKYTNRRDEIGAIASALMDTTTSLKTIMQSIQNSAAKVNESASVVTMNTTQTAQASADVAHAMNEVADGAQSQAHAIESGSEKGQLLGEKINHNADVIRALTESNQVVDTAVTDGLKEINALVSLSKSSEKETQAIAEKIKHTNSSAAEISKASQVIASIAEQTNLLALNAAIESARAGEAGKGFAVVADEIRKLAEESTASTAEIDQIVANLQGSTSDAVEKMADVLADYHKQSEKINQNKLQYEAINQAINASKEQIESLTVSGEDMRLYKDDIIEVLENLSAIAEENASSTEEVSASMEEQSASLDEIKSLGESLLHLADQLDQEVKQFKLQA